MRKDQCRLWKWRTNPDGYGVLRFKGKQILAHRAMWQAFNGPIPDGMLVLHRCDTPSCFNPNHLFMGSYADNNKDRMTKGRSAVGERSGRHKLMAEDVIEIRRRHAAGEANQSELAREFKVSSHQISVLVRNLSWRHM